MRPAGDGGDIAIIGIACIFPGAPDAETYWRNIVSGVDAVTDPPADRWDIDAFYDREPTSPDRLYCKRGGYLGDLARCDPMRYGIMPIIMNAGEPDQILSLRVAHEALADAGYAERPFDRERTEIILGRGSYPSPGFVNLAIHTIGIEQSMDMVKSLLPDSSPADLDSIRQELKASLSPLGPDTVGALIPNLTTGRVANRLDFMGTNFTIDAACASALIAVDLAARDLLTGRCDLALAGGVHLTTHVMFLTIFNQLGALSRQSQIRPFDEKADGLVAGEGVGMVVLKRRADAERAGDRIYAVIKGVGTASDGRGHGLLAPRVEGEELAMRRAYDMAGFGPETVELIEAHGTATVVGDYAEIQALKRVFGPPRGPVPTCAVGSVKSMIGHLMPAAGIAGLIKAALAVHHRVLPPTLHCETPNPKFELEKTPLYINTETRPWVHGDRTPRRAGVSAFGFGGINAHVILEEPPVPPSEEPGGGLPWETELCLLQGATRRDLIEQGGRLARYLEVNPAVALGDLACSLGSDLRPGPMRLALIASSIDDLLAKLARALRRLEDDACREIKDASGVYFFAEPLLARGKLAFLFPGHASQYPNMLKDLCLQFPEVRAAFDLADRIGFEQADAWRPSQSIFPVPNMGTQERTAVERRLEEPLGTLGAIFTASLALSGLLRGLDIRPDVVLGHSSGEFCALAAAGILTPDETFIGRLVALSAAYERRGADDQLPKAAVMAVVADRESVESMLSGEDLVLAMDNCPHQVIVVGQPDAIARAQETLRAREIVCQRLPFDRAYHTPLFRAASRQAWEMLGEFPLASPETEIYCAATMAPYPKEPGDIRELAASVLTRPVQFRGAVEALYREGTRVFVEVGARGNLTTFVEDILRGRPHLTVACDVPRRNGLTQLNHVVGLLAAHGASLRQDALYARRSLRRVSLDGAASPGESAERSRGLPVSFILPKIHLAPRTAPAPPARDHAEDGWPAPQRMAELVSLAPLAPAAEPVAVVQEHLRTMERFLAVEGEIMEAFLAATASPAPPPSLSLLGTVVSLEPGQEVVVQRVIDCAEDLFIQDHALGGAPQLSETDATLKSLAGVPFTVCIEMMAAAAALIAPGRYCTGMRQVRMRQSLLVDDPITVEIRACRCPDGDVAIEVRNPGTAGVVAEGIATFAPTRPEPPAVVPLTIEDGGPCRHSAEQMYAERLLFHGPRLRGVVSLDRSGRNGVSGRLRVLPRDDLFASTTEPRFVTDPMLLDAAAQLVGYWAAERLDAGFSVFPFRLESLEMYGDMLPVGESIRCDVEVHEVAGHQIRATARLVDADGRLWARLGNWEFWRVYGPRELDDYSRFPDRNLLGHAWPLPASPLGGAGEFVCRRVEATTETFRSFATHMIPHLALSGAERAQWKTVGGPETRRVEWAVGRAVAKDAVRALLKMRDGRDRFPADLQIEHDQLGRPFVRALAEDSVPALSIAHREGVVIALAGFCPQGRLGVDIERIRPFDDGFLQMAFDEQERGMLGWLPEARRDEWVARLWCAKEAVAKALGHGLVEGPRSLRVRAVDLATGSVTLILAGALQREFPELDRVGVIAHTATEGDWAVASSVCERAAE